MTKPTVKPKMVKPARQPITHEQIVSFWHRYPKLSLASIATFVTIAATAGPFVSGWLNQFVTQDQFKQHKDAEQRAGAWRDVQLSRMEATVARNRINDCDVIKERQHGVLSPTEHAACVQYQNDLEDANRRYMRAQDSALSMSKEKEK